MPSPTRIHIVGCSGSGKTTLARAVASRMGLAHIELDEVFWDRDWTFRDLDQARVDLAGRLAASPEGWVADGNWSSRLDGALDPATGGSDLLVWLDHPRALVMTRIIRRTVWRGLTRREIWHGNRESVRGWFSREPERNIMLWAWHSHPELRRRFGPRLGEPGVIRLSGRRAVRQWLSGLPAR